eukprot:gnl/Spiro4/12262_TR6471_c0_g2_i1.p1 gnl/Spiro4/12262_TR6471_c0_g2~~gnl/Spiro4/12262_TR6471_c0_g2_i1.p1  ORF type:complete len:400 (-),score=110.73 gnl/Spiro4/12262_TR6471_c0_g2_i1:19-1218(-)
MPRFWGVLLFLLFLCVCEGRLLKKAASKLSKLLSFVPNSSDEEELRAMPKGDGCKPRCSGLPKSCVLESAGYKNKDLDPEQLKKLALVEDLRCVETFKCRGVVRKVCERVIGSPECKCLVPDDSVCIQLQRDVKKRLPTIEEAPAALKKDGLDSILQLHQYPLEKFRMTPDDFDKHAITQYFRSLEKAYFDDSVNVLGLREGAPRNSNGSRGCFDCGLVHDFIAALLLGKTQEDIDELKLSSVELVDSVDPFAAIVDDDGGSDDRIFLFQMTFGVEDDGHNFVLLRTVDKKKKKEEDEEEQTVESYTLISSWLSESPIWAVNLGNAANVKLWLEAMFVCSAADYGVARFFNTAIITAPITSLKVTQVPLQDQWQKKAKLLFDKLVETVAKGKDKSKDVL